MLMLSRESNYMKGGKQMDREQTTIRLPAELKQQLQQQADKMGVSFNGLVINYLWQGLESK